MKKYLYLFLSLILVIIIFSLIPNDKFDISSVTNQKISVSITGEVLKPGTYELDSGATLKELLELAVLKDTGDISSLNQQIILKDKDELYIPLKGTKSKISLNTASLEELCLLPGVGEKTALAIIEYRNRYGFFQRIEDVCNVKGIGKKKYEKMKDYLKL